MAKALHSQCRIPGLDPWFRNDRGGDGWNHRLNGHEFEQAPGVGDGQGSLVCRSPWGCEESDMTERLN